MIKIPVWATKKGCRDKNGRVPTDPDYDPSTLFIPPGELDKMTPVINAAFIKIYKKKFLYLNI